MELYNEYELISHSKLADCTIFTVDMVYRPMHLHKEMELCCVLSGTCSIYTDRRSFTAGAGDALRAVADAGEAADLPGPQGRLGLRITARLAQHLADDVSRHGPHQHEHHHGG